MLTIAARVADIVAVNATMTSGQLDASVAATASPQAFDEKLGWVREAATAHGRADDIELQCHCDFVHVTTRADDRESVLGAMAPAFACDPADARDIPLTLVGSTDEIAETLLRRRERWGFTYTVVPDDAMEAFAPVVAQLAGHT
jgi:alkanesulfonate monooxygenase SsuD/methylene tetrahydromethanopterin reductase-like flavin-dependent oxidoreductase (luciferase family)